MPTVNKAPNDRWPSAARGLVVQLLAGVHGPVEWSGAPDMSILGGENVAIEGSIRPGGGEDPCSIRVHDGAHNLAIVGPLVVRGSQGRGIRITGAHDITLTGIESCDHGIESIILGNCQRAILTDLYCHDSASGAATSPDRKHGLYVSGNASGTVITRLKSENVTGSGLQVNGASLGFVIRDLHASELELLHCGSGGTPPISLMAVQGCLFERFVEDWSANDRWVVMFSDGRGPAYACRENTFRDYTIPRGTEAAEEEGSGSNTFAPGAGWSPTEPPDPEPPDPGPEPQPEPDIETALAQLATAEAELAAVQDHAGLALAAVRSAKEALSV